MKRIPGSGFTYIEITFTMVIIAVLAAIAVPNFLEAQTRAVVARSKVDLMLLKSAIETYRFETRSWPQNPVAGTEDAITLNVLTTPVQYLGQVPIDSFMQRDSNNARGARALPPTPYRYLNGWQVEPVEGLKLIEKGTGEPPADMGFVGAWLHGYGPALEITPAVSAGPGGVIEMTIYDPTNGTTSSGIIIQTLP